MPETDVIVIGAGLIGAAVAFDLRRAGYEVVVLDQEPELAARASRSNSGVLHTGFDSTPGAFETQMIRDQAARWRGVLDELNVPYQVPGALLLAHEDEADRLPEIAHNASVNGVTTKLLGASATQATAPLARAKASLLIHP